MIDSANYTLPDVAVAFFFGDPFAKTINDPSTLTITMQQIIKYQDVRIPDTNYAIPLQDCTPDWIPPMGLPMLCPQSNTAYMSGLLYATEEYAYPRFSVNYCKSGGNCIGLDDLYKITSGGRLLLYIRNVAPDSKATNYSTYQFFLDPGLYLRYFT
jgi:hypothetical protein